MSARKAFPYILLSMLLMLGALFLIYYNVIDDKRAGAASADVADELLRLLDAAETVPPEAAELSPLEDPAGLRPGARRVGEAYGDEEQAEEGHEDGPAEPLRSGEMKAISAHGVAYLGILSIPDLGVTVPVRMNYDFPGLQYSPSRYYGSYVTDDLVIAAHNYDSHFGRIHSLAIDAPIYIQDADGCTHSYKVAQVETLEPWQMAEMIYSGYALTLYTCTRGGEHRVTVRCTRAS